MIRRHPPALWSLLAAILLLHALTALPTEMARMSWRAWALPAPELLALLLAALASGRSVAGTALRALVTGVLGTVTVLKVADLAMMESLGRRFNPVGDLPLLDASVRLIAGSLGKPAAVAGVLGAIVLIVLIFVGLWWAMGRILRQAPHSLWRRRSVLAGAVVLVVAMIAAPPRGVEALTPATSTYALQRAQLAARTLTELRRFRADVGHEALATLDNPLGLIDRDVLVIFLESYGRTSFDTDFFADLHLQTLARAEDQLTAQGVATASGFLTSPTHGGQSWLAHATLANGLRIDDQTRYQAAIVSGRKTLYHHAADAGFRTAAVMPAIVRPWPEALTMGFQRILAFPDLGYRGLPFNWVTMPDQFTLAATDRLLREGDDPRRLFAQIALISSHAPWTPVPRMLPWEDLGDGTEFDAMAQEGDPPNVVWRDRDRVRAQYRDSVDYTLQAALDYALRQGEDPPLILLVGDHQAATSIGLDERREVPLHVIGPPHLVARTAAWGLTEGLIPRPGSPALPMEDLRDLFLRNFSGAGDVSPS
ncbi:sulfatase [Paracoccus gahaiensis]|uniref:Sulfatase n=1 Tax=Paracoccus gahaiensis TaxID=1706839 RepID=A0A4V5MW06_9RHOB|nr:sulfatase [Paracoccus gahaiensis]TJZ94218.1 sulfatase [Paracoccus gahaiensis]